MGKGRCWLIAVLAVIVGAAPGLSQSERDTGGTQSERLSGDVAASLGLTVLDGEIFYRIRVTPDLALGKFGAGLDVDLLVSSKTGKIRKQDWNERRDYAQIIRYVRYGQPGDPLYGRLGALDATTLGHGFIMYRYTNRADANNKRIGLEGESALGRLRFQGMTSNVGRLEVAGGRVSARPLADIMVLPVIKGLEVGGSFVGDADQDQNRHTADGVSVYGADLGFPLIDVPMFQADLYGDWAKMAAHGQGGAVGLGTTFKGILGILEIDAKLEQRFLGPDFYPSYFDAFYEIQKYREVSPGLFMRKSESLERKAREGTNGTFGELTGSVLDRVSISGSYQYYYRHTASGVLHAEADAPRLIPQTTLYGSYDKKGIETLADLGKASENTYVTLEAGREIYPHIMLIVTYQRTYEWRPEKGRYFSIEKFSPRLEARFSF